MVTEARFAETFIRLRPAIEVELSVEPDRAWVLHFSLNV